VIVKIEGGRGDDGEERVGNSGDKLRWWWFLVARVHVFMLKFIVFLVEFIRKESFDLEWEREKMFLCYNMNKSLNDVIGKMKEG
ncbi:hypothetical protein PIB30_112350, partial [Stylosanthes scabra]|nr:hypothetical protein [Stylosanthes scabra]